MIKGKKSILLTFLWIIILAFPIYSMAASINSQTYLPIVYRYSSPTPTATPIPTTTPAPNLQDGYYSGNAGYDGDLWFTVSNGGTIALGAGFLSQAQYTCPWYGYSFSGSDTITNGSFGFIVMDYQNREIIASFGCNSISNSSATCRTYYHGTSPAYCHHSSGIATLR